MYTIGYHESINYKCLLGLEHQTSDLFLNYCGIEYCSPNHSFGATLRKEHLIHIIFQGEGIFTFQNRYYHLHANQAFYIPPNTTAYHYQADTVHPWAYVWIGFDGAKSSQYLEQTSLSIQNPTCTLDPKISLLLELIQKIFDAKALTQFNEIKRVGYLYRILSLLINTSYKNNEDRKSFQYSSEVYAKYAKHIIENSYTTNTISDIADKIGIDRSYLHTLFKNTYHISPQEYLISCRLQDAAIQLIQTENSVKEIASSVGYDDAYSFSKLFKKHYLISPKEYRLTKIKSEE